MKTDMNRYLIFSKRIAMLSNYCKKNDNLSVEAINQQERYQSFLK